MCFDRSITKKSGNVSLKVSAQYFDLHIRKKKPLSELSVGVHVSSYTDKKKMVIAVNKIDY